MPPAPSFHSAGSFYWGKRKGRVKECDPDTSSAACSDKQSNIPPADSWHAIVTCCWILFQTVGPLAECLAFKSIHVFVRACVFVCVCERRCMHVNKLIYYNTFYIRVVLGHFIKTLQNLNIKHFFFWSRWSVATVLFRVCGVYRRIAHVLLRCC